MTAARGQRTGDAIHGSRLVRLEVTTLPIQQEMLDAIEVERTVHDRHRNLVVAATGTGKTVIAALGLPTARDEAATVPPFSSWRIVARSSSNP